MGRMGRGVEVQAGTDNTTGPDRMDLAAIAARVLVPTIQAILTVVLHEVFSAKAARAARASASLTPALVVTPAVGGGKCPLSLLVADCCARTALLCGTIVRSIFISAMDQGRTSWDPISHVWLMTGSFQRRFVYIVNC